MLSGVVRLYDGTDWVESHPGDFAYVPEGGLHGFRNESGAPASMLILFAPGAPREAYFEGLARFARRHLDAGPRRAPRRSSRRTTTTTSEPSPAHRETRRSGLGVEPVLAPR